MGIDPVSQRAAFIDRDGVINRAVIRDGAAFAPQTLDAVEVLPGVADALERLRAAGWARVVVTNQPDIARGTQSLAVVEMINRHLLTTLDLTEIRMCPHDDVDDCACRKPRPGMLLQEPRYDIAASVMIGDRWRDIEAGQRAGVRATILVESGHREPCEVEPTARVASLAEAVDWLLGADFGNAAGTTGDDAQ